MEEAVDFFRPFDRGIKDFVTFARAFPDGFEALLRLDRYPFFADEDGEQVIPRQVVHREPFVDELRPDVVVFPLAFGHDDAFEKFVQSRRVLAAGVGDAPRAGERGEAGPLRLVVAAGLFAKGVGAGLGGAEGVGEGLLFLFEEEFPFEHGEAYLVVVGELPTDD